MNRPVLAGLAALCSFIAAGFRFYERDFGWVTWLQLLAGVLMTISAIRMNGKDRA